LQKYERSPARYLKQAVGSKAVLDKVVAENSRDPVKAVRRFVDGLLAKLE